jgi:hypothetical protein
MFFKHLVDARLRGHDTKKLYDGKTRVFQQALQIWANLRSAFNLLFDIVT